MLNDDKRVWKNDSCPEGTYPNNSYMNKLDEILHT